MQMTFYKISTIDIKTFAENRSNSLSLANLDIKSDFSLLRHGIESLRKKHKIFLFLYF